MGQVRAVPREWKGQPRRRTYPTSLTLSLDVLAVDMSLIARPNMLAFGHLPHKAAALFPRQDMYQ